MEAFAWINKIVTVFLNFFPHLIIVQTTYAGVKWRNGGKVKPLYHNNGFLRTGLHLYLPFTTIYELAPIKRQTTHLVTQYLCTEDGKTIGVGGIVVFEVDDPVMLLTSCYDYEEVIKDYSLASIRRVMSQRTLHDLQHNIDVVDEKLTESLKTDLKPFGIKVINVTLIDLAPCKTIGLWGVSEA